MEDIKTEEGIAKGLPLSDIQSYNKILSANTEELKRKNRIEFIGMVLKIIIVFTFLWLIYYTITNDILNNVIFEITKCN